MNCHFYLETPSVTLRKNGEWVFWVILGRFFGILKFFQISCFEHAKLQKRVPDGGPANASDWRRHDSPERDQTGGH